MLKKLSFSAEDKLKRKSDFESLRQSSKRYVGRLCIVYFKKNQLGKARLGISVSRKFGSAVHRNKFKRRIREMFRLNKNLIPAMDIHFVAKAGATKDKTKVNDIKEDFSHFLAHIL